ncbi:MAG TPA: AraC family transcriptional regulator [Tepidisphaeraceae bacterium]|nr:AraC family transcriptional regulator [Tepidisphaeraceae bacterium]
MRENTEQAYKERVLRVLVYIQQHLDETIELDTLARIAHFSSYHFHRLFRGMVGESVMEHVRRLRLERAAHRLKFGDQPVTRIAFEAGYETHEAFSRAFRAMFDQSPSLFRDAHQAMPFRAAPSDVHFVTDGNIKDFRAARETKPLDVRIESLAPMRVAFTRHVGPYSECGAAWEKLMPWAGRAGLLIGRPRILGIVHDDPDITPPQKVRYDACLVVERDFETQGEIGMQEIPGGDYALTTHRGPYDMLSITYGRLLGHWLPASGREPRSTPGFEIYQNSPAHTAPADLLTDIYIPLTDQENQP